MMKNFLLLLVFTSMFLSVQLEAQDGMNVVNVQKLKLRWPENGTVEIRDSLLTIYNDNIVRKNEYILSHREYFHFFTESNLDYLVIEEYKDLASMEASFRRTAELEDKYWSDAASRDAFFDALDSYFETWHGDHLYHINPRLSKN
jgi:hypothetical protein